MTEDSKPRTRRVVKPESVAAAAEPIVAPVVPQPKPAPRASKTDVVFKRRLSQGDHGPMVAEVQRLLSTRGMFDGKQDGRYGTLLAKAVRLFQGSQNMKVNGEVDIRTWEALTA